MEEIELLGICDLCLLVVREVLEHAGFSGPTYIATCAATLVICICGHLLATPTYPAATHTVSTRFLWFHVPGDVIQCVCVPSVLLQAPVSNDSMFLVGCVILRRKLAVGSALHQHVGMSCVSFLCNLQCFLKYWL